ncbi:hypothetical protein ACVIIW_003676 [Bradyrhizobium sp. USDA 4449]
MIASFIENGAPNDPGRPQRPNKRTHLRNKQPDRLPCQPDQHDIQLLPLRSLKPAKKNARTHSQKQVTRVAHSIIQFGWTYPILADEYSQIIYGHGGWEAAQQLGLKDVPVLVIRGLSDAEKRALALVDNKITANRGDPAGRLSNENVPARVHWSVCRAVGSLHH